MLEHVRVGLWVVVGHIADAFELVSDTPNEIVSIVEVAPINSKIRFETQAIVK